MVEIHIPEPVFTIEVTEDYEPAGAEFPVVTVAVLCGDYRVFQRTYDTNATGPFYSDDPEYLREKALQEFAERLATLLALEVSSPRDFTGIMPVSAPGKTTLRWPDGPNELREHMLQSHGYEYLSFFNSAVVDSATRRHFEAHADATAASLDHTHESRPV